MLTQPAPQHLDPRAEATDEALVVRYRRGERAAFTELVGRYLTPIYTFAWHLLRDDGPASQVVVDTFRDIVSRAAEFKHETRFATWAYAIALNKARQLAREPRNECPPSAATDRTPSVAARQALAQLPQLQLEALLLAELGGLRLDDIAELLALDAPTLRTQLGYAIEFLRQAFSGLEEYARALR